MTHWSTWHEAYADPASELSLRLRVVQDEVRRWLDDARPGELRAVSACAGLGVDLTEVLREHPRGDDVSALLMEWDADLSARSQAPDLPRVLALQGDAGSTAVYGGAVPADLLMLCGVFGNVPDDDIRRTIGAASSLCAPGAAVIWTRHRRAPDATTWIRRAWAEAGFEETAFTSPGPARFAVGACRLVGEPGPFDPSLRLFTFT